jgi:hypothetical protein
MLLVFQIVISDLSQETNYDLVNARRASKHLQWRSWLAHGTYTTVIEIASKIEVMPRSRVRASPGEFILKIKNTLRVNTGIETEAICSN